MKIASFLVVILFAMMIGLSGTGNIYAEEEVTQEGQLDEEMINPEEDMINPEEDMKDEEVWDEGRDELSSDEEKEIDESESLEEEEIEEGRRYLDVDDVERL